MISGELKFESISNESIRYRLIELPDSNVLEELKHCKDISVRGQPDDETIMIVGNKSFKLRELCTSNTFMLINEKGSVKELTFNLLEATSTVGQTERLTRLQKEFPYTGPSEMVKDGIEALTPENLNGLIQASDDELALALSKNQAILINGHYRILDSSYICRFFEIFFTSALVEDWDYANEALKKSEIISKFTDEFYDEFSKPILKHIFCLFQADDILCEVHLWNISAIKVCRFYANQLLRAKGEWSSLEFRRAWKKLVGEFEPDLSMLRGLALIDELASDQSEYRLTHFDSAELPILPNERFRTLFRARAKWYYDEILPFIEDLTDSEKKLQGLLLKYGRFSTDTKSGKKCVTPLLPP